MDPKTRMIYIEREREKSYHKWIPTKNMLELEWIWWSWFSFREHVTLIMLNTVSISNYLIFSAIIYTCTVSGGFRNHVQ